VPLSEEEYRDLLQDLRRLIRREELGAVDERIASQIQGSEGPYFDLVSYLRLLISEMSLGSDDQLRSVLRRVRESAETESGSPIGGFRIQLTPEESRIYNTDSFDLAPAPNAQEAASELRAVLEELEIDRRNRDRPRER